MTKQEKVREYLSTLNQNDVNFYYYLPKDEFIKYTDIYFTPIFDENYIYSSLEEKLEDFKLLNSEVKYKKQQDYKNIWSSAEQGLRLSKINDEVDSYSNKELYYWDSFSKDDIFYMLYHTQDYEHYNSQELFIRRVARSSNRKEEKMYELKDLVSTAIYDYIVKAEGFTYQTIDIVEYLTIIATKYPQTVKDEYLFIIPNMIWLNMIGKKEACEVYAPLFCQGIDPYTEFLRRKEEKKNKVYNEDFDELELVVKTVIDKNSDKVKEFKKGKKGLIGFFIKEAKKINDTFDPKHLQDFFLNKLS